MPRALGGVAALVFTLGTGAVGGSPTEGEPAVIGEMHPALEVETLDGDVVNARRVAGHPLVVDFFATWCGPCHQALADLLAARGAAPADTVWILVDLQEPAAAVKAWAATAHLPPGALVGLDLHGAAYRRWGARKLPTTFLVDGSGVVRHINRGWGPGYRARLERWLEDLAPRTIAPSMPR